MIFIILFFLKLYFILLVISNTYYTDYSISLDYDMDIVNIFNSLSLDTYIV